MIEVGRHRLPTTSVPPSETKRSGGRRARSGLAPGAADAVVRTSTKGAVRGTTADGGVIVAWRATFRGPRRDEVRGGLTLSGGARFQSDQRAGTVERASGNRAA